MDFIVDALLVCLVLHIIDSIIKQIQIGEYKNISNFYGDGSAAHKIVEKLCRLPLENISQKKLWIKDEKR